MRATAEFRRIKLEHQQKVALFALSGTAFAFYFGAVLSLHLDILFRFYVFLAAALVTSFSFWLILRHGALDLGASIATFTVVICMGVLAYFGGGFSESGVFWLIGTPLAAALYGGFRTGMLGLLLTFIALLILTALEVVNGKPVNLTPSELRYEYELLHHLAQLVLVGFSLVVYWRRDRISDAALLDRVKQLDSEIDARREAEAEAENANKTKSLFLANMSHEIRTPMNGVLGVLEILSREPLTPSQAEFVDLGLDSSKSLLRIINDILDISKIEVGKMELNTNHFDLREMLSHIAQVMSDEADKKGLKFEFRDSLCHCQVIGDRDRIEQILNNLIANAIKFTQDGEVIVTASMTLRTHAVGQFEFKIMDTGIGIPAEKLPQLFEPFSQLENLSTKRYSGTGLGLSIANFLAELMGGEIEYRRRESGGSCFVVRLPLEIFEQATVVKASLADSVVETARSCLPAFKRILIVDDNRANMEIMLVMLAGHDLILHTATTGIEALDQIEANHEDYDLILMDCQMPDMDGYEATGHIREIYSKSVLPIVAITANAMSGDREKCLDAGMNDYLAKPINPEALVEKVGHWLN